MASMAYLTVARFAFYVNNNVWF